MTQRTYTDSPFLEAVHPHIAVADTKFNADGLFKVKGRGKLDDPAVADMKAKIDAACEAAREEFFAEGGEGAKLTPAEKKKYEVYHPYTVEEDDQGNETGTVLFEFKQNAKIKLRDGTVKDIEIGIYDAKGNTMRKDPGPGSVLRVKYAMRPIPMKSLKQVGVRLDFCAVQVKDLKEFQRSGGFGAVDGYEDDGSESEGFGEAPEGSATGAADY